MPRRKPIRRALSLALIVAGLCLAAYPIVSVWRVGGEVLSQLPEAAATVDDRPALALFDGDFVLARRTYTNTTPAEVDASLRAAGFDEQFRRDGHDWRWRTCCGDYDAALARVDGVENGEVEVALSVFDDDVQATWWILMVVGALLAAMGVMLARSGRQPPSSTPGSDHDRPLPVREDIPA